MAVLDDEVLVKTLEYQWGLFCWCLSNGWVPDF